MSDSEYYYNYFRRKYYDSCNQINNCQHQIYNLNNQRPRVVNRINQLNAEIRNVQFAISGLHNSILREGSINSKLTAVANKTTQASDNFREMVRIGGINNKNLTDVFSSETAKTKNALNRVWNTLKSKKNILNAKLTNLQAELRRANSNLQNIDSSKRQYNANLSYWRGQKNNNYYNMEYYRRKMMQEAYSYY